MVKHNKQYYDDVYHLLKKQDIKHYKVYYGYAWYQYCIRNCVEEAQNYIDAAIELCEYMAKHQRRRQRNYTLNFSITSNWNTLMGLMENIHKRDLSYILFGVTQHIRWKIWLIKPLHSSILQE